MRCRDVKRRLNNKVEPNSELIDHLKECPSCASEAEASRILSLSFKPLRGNTFDDHTPIEELKSRLQTLTSRENRKEQTIMSKVKDRISDHPRYSLGVIAAVCLFAFVLLVPISYNKIVGYNLVLSGIEAGNGYVMDTARDVVDAMGYGDVVVSTKIDDKKMKIVFEDLPSKTAVREITSAMSSLIGAELITEVTPVIINEMGSIYGQVKDKIEEIRIDTDGKTDKQIEDAIRQGLREKGYRNPRVSVKTSPDGKREITIDTDVRRQTDKGTYEAQEKRKLIIDEGDSVSIESDPLERIEIDSEGKTDARIEAEIREKLKARGMDDAEVTVEELPDGRREINIEVKKEKKKD